MPSLPTLAVALETLNKAVVLLTAIANSFNLDEKIEEVEKHEEFRRHAISRYIRKTSRCVVHKNSEPRSTILPRTRSVLSVQDGIYDASEHRYIGSGSNSGEHVRNEPRTVRSRKRIFYEHNGGRSYRRIQKKIPE